MKPNKASLLLHPVFVISLLTLLLNDFFWKEIYHNSLTGKLSDFAGLVVFPIFLNEVFRKVPKLFIFIFTVLFFAWWKSPFSQPVINALYSFNIQLHRTIDYTDLLALAVLPFIYFLKPVIYGRLPVFQNTMKNVVAAVAFFALCADTPYRMLPYDRYEPNEVRYSEDFCWTGTTEQLLQDLTQKGMEVTEEKERYYSLSPEYQQLFYRTKTKDSSYQWTPVLQGPDSLLYFKERLYSNNYLVSKFKFEDQEFRNIRFRIDQDDHKGKVCVQMISFESVSGTYETFPDKKAKKTLKKYFEALFGIQKK